MKNQLKIMASMASITLLIGCHTTQSIHSTSKLTDDKIIAIAQVQDSTTSSTPSKIAFVGEKYTYIANHGGSQVFNIINQTQENERLLANDFPIRFQMIDESHFEGTLLIQHTTPTQLLSKDQRQHLNQIGFTETQSTRRPTDQYAQDYPLAKIKMQGSIHHALQHQTQLPNLLKQPYPIQIIKPSETIQTSQSRKMAKKVGKITGGIILAPLAIAAGIVIAPIYLGLSAFSDWN